METAVFVGGLSLYLVATVVYLKDAYQKSPVWAWVSILVPPIALVYYCIYWQRRWPLFTAHTVALTLTLVGGLLLVRAHPVYFDHSALAPVRDAVAPASRNRPLNVVLEEFASSGDVSPYIGRIDGVMGGRLFGDPVQIETVELVDGTLRFRRGEGFYPQREVAVFLGITEFDVDDRWELDVTPASTDAPIIHVSRYDARTGQLKTEVYDQGYWLELVLSDRRSNEISGFVRLLLPNEQRDFIAGNFESYTSRLRFDGDEIDRFHDSVDTLEYVAQQHLESRFKKAVRDVSFLDTHYLGHVALPTGRTVAELTLVDNSVHTIPLALFKGEQGWTVDTRSTDDLRVAIETLMEQPPAAGPPEPEENPEKLFGGSDYSSLVGKRIKVISYEGKAREGLLSQVESSQLVLHQRIDKGFMDIYLPKRQIEQVVVLNNW
ncbi:MAG: hypothetical protein R3208_12820 [Ketobacteraceae bacterium]|nr:hypothetical protein [Ketobacteraceae bacterium]